MIRNPHVAIPQRVYDLVREAARLENRSIANYILKAILERLNKDSAANPRITSA